MDNGKPPRRWWSVVGWNVLFMSLCAALIFTDWEAWFHLRAPFTEPRVPTRFEPGVGLLYEPGAEMRWTNHAEFWVAQRANRWGFLDRGPPTPEQAAQTCHIAFIGDSYVEARGIPVISLHDYLVRQGRKPRDGTFASDSHWNPTGHQWVAEALLERLRQRPEVCGVSGT